MGADHRHPRPLPDDQGAALVNWLRASWIRLRSLFRKDQLDRDLQNELATHLDMHIADNLRAGMSPEEARRNALLSLGGIEQTKESVRDQRAFPFLESLIQDMRFALRMFRKSPSFTTIAVFTLALGIGANTATFSVSNTFLRHPISFPEVDRLAMVMNQAPGQTEGWSEVSPADLRDWQMQSHSFESIGAYDWADLNLTGAGEPVKVQGFRVSANFFEVLRATPLLGRTFSSGEDEPGQDHVMILSAGLWHRQFGSDPAIAGRIVRLDGTPTQIIGVMKDDVRFPFGAELWIPLALSTQEKVQRSSHYLAPIARLKSGTTLAQAQTELSTIQNRLRTSFPRSETGWGVLLIPLGEFVAGPGHGYTILTLCAVAFVLLIACTNVTNLLLARSIGRQSEFAIRVALGASRSRLVRLALVESTLLAMSAMVFGLLIGSVWISLIRANMPPEVERFIPGWDQVRLDRGVFLYTFAVAFAAGLLAGILPALYGSGRDPNDALKETGRGPGAGVSRARLRSAFVVAEVALSLVLLVGAGLMVKGVHTLLSLNFKFAPQSVLTFRVALPASRFATPPQRLAFFDALTEQLARNAGVQSSAAALEVPFSGGSSGSFSIEGRPMQPGEYQVAQFNQVTTAFFQLLHVPLVEGREFDLRDAADSTPVAIISQSLARRFWPGRSPLGHRIKSGEENSTDSWATIVGVVAEVRYDPWRHDVLSSIYFPFRQRPAPNAYVMIRTAAGPKSLFPLFAPPSPTSTQISRFSMSCRWIASSPIRSSAFPMLLS